MGGVRERTLLLLFVLAALSVSVRSQQTEGDLIEGKFELVDVISMLNFNRIYEMCSIGYYDI